MSTFTAPESGWYICEPGREPRAATAGELNGLRWHEDADGAMRCEEDGAAVYTWKGARICSECGSMALL